jgi:hypothetical protein
MAESVRFRTLSLLVDYRPVPKKKPGCLGGLSGLPRSQGALARGTKTAPMLLTPVICASFKKARRPKPTPSMMFPTKRAYMLLLVQVLVASSQCILCFSQEVLVVGIFAALNPGAANATVSPKATITDKSVFICVVLS